MVAEVGVHDDDIVAGRELQAVDVGGAEAEFACARLQFDVLGADGGDELLCDFLGAVGRAVVDDDDFPIEVAGGGVLVSCDWDRHWYFSVLGFECLLEKPDDDGQVAAFVVGR